MSPELAPIKALTLHQPYAQLVALGVKTVETRSWSTGYRGPLAIHAGRSNSAMNYLGWLEEHHGEAEPTLEPFADRITIVDKSGRGILTAVHDLPLGAVVAIARLVDVVPIRGSGQVVAADGHAHLVDDVGGVLMHLRGLQHGPRPEDFTVVERIEGQRPFGDFTPGRWAWLLDDVGALDEPVPARGRQGLWNLHGLQVPA